MKLLRIVLLAVCSLFTQTVFAQDGAEVTVADINLPNLRWGNQQANFEVTNKSEYLKFIAVVSTISFTESYFKPVRKVRTNYILGPFESKILTPHVFVPGNYGKAVITIQLFDVIDTADILLPRQKFFEQPISVQYHIPDAALSYLSDRITLPPLIDRGGTWDNDLSRLLLFLLRENKTFAEIAKITDADEEFIKQTADAMVLESNLKKVDDRYVPVFAVLRNDEVAAYSDLVKKFSDSLVSLVERNLPAYRHVRDTLARTGLMSADTLDFLNSGGILYREYPTIAGLFLWYDLGKQFVTENKSFAIFEGTDYCNLYTPFFMYAIQGGVQVNGHHFCSLNSTDGGTTIDFSDEIPRIECEEYYREKIRARKPVTWKFVKEDEYESFVYSPFVVEKAVRALDEGSEELIGWGKKEFEAIAKTQGFTNFAFGPRYWFWNWTATMTLEKLVKKGVLVRRGNGHYQFQAI